RENALTLAIEVRLVLSHLACADDAQHAVNASQLESFQRVAALFPHSDSSLSNSAGIGLGARYRVTLVRAGIVMYGAPPVAALEAVVKPVATARARVLQLRRADAGQIVGYGAAARLTRDSVLAVTGAGYADG